MRVLVVDDEWLITLMVVSALSEAGHHVVGPVHSVDAALSLAERQDIDLALLDIDLGRGGNGVDLARALNERHRIPTLFASSSNGDARRAADVALGLLRKPYSSREIAAAVEVAGLLVEGQRPASPPACMELF